MKFILIYTFSKRKISLGHKKKYKLQSEWKNQTKQQKIKERKAIECRIKTEAKGWKKKPISLSMVMCFLFHSKVILVDQLWRSNVYLECPTTMHWKKSRGGTALKSRHREVPEIFSRTYSTFIHSKRDTTQETNK